MMHYVDYSMMYHLIRGQSVIKLYIIYNMLEVSDGPHLPTCSAQPPPAQVPALRVVFWPPVFVRSLGDLLNMQIPIQVWAGAGDSLS